MDSVKEAADKAATAVDSGLNQASSTVKSTLAQATAAAQGWLAQGQTYWDTAKVITALQCLRRHNCNSGWAHYCSHSYHVHVKQAHANETMGYVGTLEDEAFGYLKGQQQCRRFQQQGPC
jgi:hypothetical protein